MITLSQRREVSEFRKRYRWMALFVMLVFGGIIVRVAQVQLVQSDRWSGIAQQNITKTLELPATRGVIRDVAGRVVASNRPSYDVFTTPRLLQPEDLDRIASLMGLSREGRQLLQTRIDEIPFSRRSHQLELFRDIDREQLAALETHLAELPALDIVTVPLRDYPYATLGAHLIGYLNEVNAEDMKRADDPSVYHSGDRIGRSGLEKRYEALLRGARGFRRLVVDARGESLDGTRPDSLDVEMLRQPVPGHEIRLTLDMALMEAFDREFRPYPSGAAVVVDIHTGAIRALYSKPVYDPNEMSSGLTTKRYAELTGDPFRPLIDKTMYETYFPGSTFKSFTALAALQDAVVDPMQRIECLGSLKIGRQRFRCNKRHEWVDLYDSVVQSCNVYFWVLAESVGLERINRYAKAFGFAERSGIGVNSEAKGFLATREWYAEHYGQFRIGYTLNTAIGQGNTRVTVLQLALAYAAIANGGSLYVPQVVQNIRSPDGSLSETFQPRINRDVGVAPGHLDLMRRSLIDVVQDESGTAYRARNKEGVRVAGKTGTAQVVSRKGRSEESSSAWYLDRSHGWFAGFAPADDPQVAFAVLVEHGGSGGASAAPIATAVMQRYLTEIEPEEAE
ncbi:MAG: penicillin-binding protein 2 [Deltaproteobacteria bacterium]|nr:penicillin-binding protein 2 [Deltaproteobacteria bacterium]NND28911.1 penicillin-binding protein 2 [Myxococcales bacterium]MBT8464074.1 penicillin-binding protein 2 [Deltaproteobacteria bacterium]MBT8483330.1 penicillin-binding protein 2 [Deltaproteobacteria bacterium]NNK05935.1 penicillin-binding protein 2 [Myxococcales bacterium]